VDKDHRVDDRGAGALGRGGRQGCCERAARQGRGPAPPLPKWRAEKAERVARLRAVFGPNQAATRQEEQAGRIAQLRAELARDRAAARDTQAAPPDPDRQAQDY
jgi:hypothetical protein